MTTIVIPELRVSTISGTQGSRNDRSFFPWVPAPGLTSEAGMTAEFA